MIGCRIGLIVVFVDSRALIAASMVACDYARQKGQEGSLFANWA